MQVFLKKHGPGHSHHGVKFSWSREGAKIRINFQLNKRTSAPWITDPSFGGDYKANWGLWNTDVAEAFLQLRKSPEDVKAPYLEIQLSPANQPFALIVTEPRKTFYTPENLEFKTTSEIEGRVWIGSMEVTLPSEFNGQHLYGGFYSCLSQTPREFYALEPNPEEAPDFHRPELFLNLDVE